MNSFFAELFGTADIVFEVGIPTVDDDVALLKSLCQSLNGLFRRTSRGDHEPGHARCREFRGKLI